jgi:hypothetical protein
MGKLIVFTWCLTYAKGMESPKRIVRQWTLNFITIAFAIALALLFVLVLRSIAVQISPPPNLRSEAYPDVSTKVLCEEAGGRWITQAPVENISGARPLPVVEKTPSYCQGPLTFEREREAQEEASRQTSLFVFAIGGAVVIAISLLVGATKPIAPGLMIGGIASFFIAGTQIWMLAPGLGRLITIIVIFLILVGVGLYALRDQHH